MDIQEPKITADQILKVEDRHFNNGNVCIVSGCATGIGRACAIAAAVNQLHVLGLDVDDREAEKTQALAHYSGRRID